MKVKLSIIICIVIFFSNTAIAGKKRCKPLLDKLHNIQAQQRQGYSAKKGLSLQNRADKVRDKWWQCENASIYSQSKKHKKKQKKKAKHTLSISANTSNVYNGNSGKVIKPFATSQAIVIKSRFKGKKQQAWLNYYQQPQKCQRAKTTKIFAFCVEDKSKQQEAFIRQYQK
jgi:hypothetical protein